MRRWFVSLRQIIVASGPSMALTSFNPSSSARFLKSKSCARVGQGSTTHRGPVTDAETNFDFDKFGKLANGGAVGVLPPESEKPDQRFLQA